MEYKDVERMLKERGMKVSELARATGISYSTFTDWKAGRYTPKYEKLKKIADYFGVPIDTEEIANIDYAPYARILRNMREQMAPGLSEVMDLYVMFNDADRNEILTLMEVKASKYRDDKKEDSV